MGYFKKMNLEIQRELLERNKGLKKVKFSNTVEQDRSSKRDTAMCTSPPPQDLKVASCFLWGSL